MPCCKKRFFLYRNNSVSATEETKHKLQEQLRLVKNIFRLIFPGTTSTVKDTLYRANLSETCYLLKTLTSPFNKKNKNSV